MRPVVECIFALTLGIHGAVISRDFEAKTQHRCKMHSQGQTMIVFLTKDLMMSSNASSHARQHKIQFKTVDSIESVAQVIESNRPHVLLIDLQAPGLVVERLGEMIRELPDSVRPLTIAFAQHVNHKLLEQATSAGFDQILTRGQVNSQMGQIVADAG